MTRFYRWFAPIAATGLGIVSLSTAPLFAEPQAGIAAPLFQLEDAGTGQKISFKDYAGQVVLLKFWRWGCPYSRAAIKMTETIFRDYGARGVRVLAINVKESKEDILKYKDLWAAQMGQHISYSILVGAGAGASRDYNITGVPTFVVVGRDGKISWAESGYDENVDAVVKAELDKALAATTN